MKNKTEHTKFIRKVALIFVINTFLYVGILSQTLHGIIVANTDEPQIGISCVKDVQSMTARINTIARSINHKPEIKIIQGSAFIFDNVIEYIKPLSCTNDIVIFYYSGHGANTNESLFPSLAFNDGLIELEKIHNLLKKKNPRLLFTIGDCCNNILKQTVHNKGFKPVVTQDSDSLPNYRHLFIVPKGDLLVSASTKGQFAHGNDEIGGYFTHEFLQAITCAINYSTSSSWNIVMKDTETRLLIHTFDKGAKQKPHYAINIEKAIDPNPQPQPQPQPTPSPVISYEEINKYFSNLMDATQNQVSLRNEYKKYFENNSRVDIYKDGTLTDMMTVEDFLDRLVVHCNKIYSINLIQNLSKQTKDGSKYLQITVQEIWKKTKD